MEEPERKEGTMGGAGAGPHMLRAQALRALVRSQREPVGTVVSFLTLKWVPPGEGGGA